MINIAKRSFSVRNTIDEYIRGEVDYPLTGSGFPLVLILHGFKGFREWGFFPYITRRIAEAGFITVCFDFSLNGMAGGTGIVENPGNFARNTVSAEIGDVHFLVENINSFTDVATAEIKNVWNGEIYLLGHSLGGGISIVAAYENNRVKKVAAWASIGKFDRYTLHQKRIWKEVGYNEFFNVKTNQVLRINVSYLNDIEQNSDRFDLKNIVKSFTKPLLFVHGKEDLTVKVRETEEIYNTCNKEFVRYKVIGNTGHTFGIEHPFSGTSVALENALEPTIKFFRE